MDDFMSKLANAKPVDGYGDRIKSGSHRLVLKSFREKETPQQGKIIAAEFRVKSSSGGHEVGDLVSNAWLISRSGWQGEQEWNRASTFLMSLFGTEDRTKAAESGGKIRLDDQRGQGLEIDVFGKEPKEEGGYVDVVWSNVPGQTAQTVRTNRDVFLAQCANDPSPTPQNQNTPAAAAPQAVAPAVAPQAVAPAPAAAPAAAPEDDPLAGLI